ncbi:HVO_2523 family zinc finger protein [Natrinema altunense]|uniref:HVO_2523 family zinc finger protein n=1 Tax=Natrinema altunense TaxID=222984 RepID=UPI0013EE71EA|nr:HVO_2523 family zinc finger protein [Natrinema altunense]
MTADGGRGADDGVGTDGSSDRTAAGPRCPHCDAAMYKRHCKYVCPQHGVIIDCSDPFR